MFIRFLFYNEICFNCREFRRKEDIYSTWFYAGSAFIKKYWTDEESIEIHLLNQLVCLLPNFSFTLFFIIESFFRITPKCSSFSFYQIDSLWLFIDFLWHSFLLSNRFTMTSIAMIQVLFFFLRDFLNISEL